MQKVTLKNTRVLFAAALPMNNHIVNKTRVLIGAKVAPQFEKMIQKEYEQMQRMRYFDPHRSAYIPIQTLPDGRIQLAIRSTENNCRYNRRQAERMMNSPCDLVLYLNAYHFLLALSAIRVYNQRSGGGGSIRRPSSTELLFRGLALNQLAGLYRDRDPFCQFGMFDQDFQKLFQGFFCFGLVHVVSPPFNIFIIQDFLYIVKGFL